MVPYCSYRSEEPSPRVAEYYFCKNYIQIGLEGEATAKGLGDSSSVHTLASSYQLYKFHFAGIFFHLRFAERTAVIRKSGYSAYKSYA
jgi:hypothetical protein